MIKANSPSLTSWVEIAADSDFPIQNIPFGIISYGGNSPRPASRIGDYAIDLSVLSDLGYFDSLGIDNLGVFYAPVLNDFIALGKPVWQAVRQQISDLLNIENQELQGNENHTQQVLRPIHEVTVHLPVEVGDYTDFYSSIDHATNVGTMFRDPDNALFPNWKHLPVGYHGRSSSIVVSGAEIHRPKGQTKADDAESPTFGPSRLFDFELEMAFVTGKQTQLGEAVDVNKAEDYIFGMLIFNDLSARDIQKWEYVPLGPFLSKNFGSVVSPWIITLDALEPFKLDAPAQDPEVLPYLKVDDRKNHDIKLDVFIKPDGGEENHVCASNYKYLYWTMSQQLAHQTVNGCNINVGDMYASGTISGPTPESYGSMLELSWRGSKPIRLNDGTERRFVNDNDTIIMRAYAEKDGVRIGFGESVTKVLPSI